MRVMYFSASFGPHDQRFLRALARTRHDVFFLRLDGPLSKAEGVDLPEGIRSLSWRGTQGRFTWLDARRLARELRGIVRDVQPDLIHAGPIQTCAFLAVLSGFRPILAMSWGFDLMQDADRSPLWRWVTRYTLRRSAYFVSDAGVTRERAVGYGMNPTRTAVFPWGVNLNRFRPARDASAQAADSAYRSRRGRRQSQQLNDRGLVILCNRSWEARYGVDVLARAFVSAAKRLPGASLILVGSGSEAPRIRRILEAGGVLGRVQFGGQIKPEEMIRWYRKADLFVSPSHVDGSSVSLMEAMASGLPVLVSDIPANLEWVSEDVNGWVFRDGDAQQLADRIVWIAQHKAAFGRIGRAARKTAEQRADWTRNFKVLLESYELASNGGPRT